MMTRQDQDNSHTPRGIEKTEKGKRAHACGFPGCDKVYTCSFMYFPAQRAYHA
jgi:hypothetical protein